jgi:hypothetical protein
MKMVKALTILALLTLAAVPLNAAENDTKAFGQFQEILAGIENRSFAPIQAAIDKSDLSNRILKSGKIEPEARKILNDNFWQLIEKSFMEDLPPTGLKTKIQLVDFAFENGKGYAGVRFNHSKYEYAYLVFDLRYDSRSRLKIVDWFVSSMGQMFSARIGEQLVILMPTKAATRKLISISNPSDLQLFQVTEIFKASRDRQAARFFEIYDEFDDSLKREPLIAKYAVYFALASKDADRLASGLNIFVDVYSQDPNFALMLSDLFVRAQNYEESYVSLGRFHENFSVKEGAVPARLSALALALGKLEDAEKYAVEATVVEPSLELGWWSLLRARARAQDHVGALEPLTSLEDNFGYKLDAGKLRRDKFQGFTTLVSSAEFKEWRAGRN